VWIDHDPEKVVGRVRSLFIAEDVFNGKDVRWHFAIADGEFPDWVARGRGVSVGTKPLHRRAVGSRDRLQRDPRVGLHSHSNHDAANAGAQVSTVRPFEPPAPAAPPARSVTAVRRAPAARTVSRDRYLSRSEVEHLVALAAELDADTLSGLIAQSGTLPHPDGTLQLGVRGLIGVAEMAPSALPRSRSLGLRVANLNGDRSCRDWARAWRSSLP
jgi:hypothetical protein